MRSIFAGKRAKIPQPSKNTREIKDALMQSKAEVKLVAQPVGHSSYHVLLLDQQHTSSLAALFPQLWLDIAHASGHVLTDDGPPLRTATGRPIDWFTTAQVEQGIWKEEEIPSEVVGLTRPMTVYRTSRKTNLITYDWHGDKHTFCPPMWWDLAIGSGACGLGCRACF
jgi:hypothetical protein